MTTQNKIQPRQLGSKGLTVFPLALGCMGTYPTNNILLIQI
ncbi:hypothetical protein [Nostoc sp. JL31]|nr:hypothetical protein [Nostoc sp. JL31]